MFETIAVDYLGATHIGYVRQENQDVWQAIGSIGLFILADGMGGRQGGLRAAELAVKEVSQYLTERVKHFSVNQELSRKWVCDAIQHANKIVFEEGKNNTLYQGMGTTLVVLWVFAQEVIVAHVGDSRLYCMRHQQLYRLTEDHSIFSPSKGGRQMLSRAIGINPVTEVTIKIFQHQPEDTFLLCSDGLSGSLTDKEIEKMFLESGSLEHYADLLMKGSLQRGGKDNVTFIIVQL